MTVDNYLEAVGVLTAMKAGVPPESVRQPLAETKVETEVFETTEKSVGDEITRREAVRRVVIAAGCDPHDDRRA